MTYAETIDYLYTKLPMFSRIGNAAFKKDLTNTIALCEALDNPHQKFKSIHVGGTNGKGSVSHMLAAVLQSAGYKTGLYTSPHLKDFRERIRINGEMVSKEFVIDFVERIEPLIEKIEPSFFEITVAMAFDYFAQQNVDIAVIEVGLGGRLDSTNIITPEVSVITNIGWDHMNMLGNSLEEIASEKAGIIKEHIPVVIGERKAETENIFLKAAQSKQSSIQFAEDYFHIEAFNTKNDLLDISISSKNRIENYELDLTGIYQTKNILTVLQSIEVLRQKEFKLKDADIKHALKHTKTLTGLRGRWDMIHQNPTVVLEVAHNKDGIEQLLKHLQTISFTNLHIVLGMVKDKDAESVLQLFPKTAIYYFTQSHIPRALEAENLKQKAEALELKGNHFADVNIALKAALSNASKDDMIIVVGSIFLVAEVEENNF
ncbi:MAG: dihydrofolate synthase [Chitinophagaceae bacterium]